MCITKESFQAVKTAVVAQLINDPNSDSRNLIRKAIQDKDVAVRKSTLSNIKIIPTDLIPDYERLLGDSSYDVIASTLTLLNASNPSKISDYLASTKGIIGVVGRNVEIKWLELTINWYILRGFPLWA